MTKGEEAMSLSNGRLAFSDSLLAAFLLVYQGQIN